MRWLVLAWLVPSTAIADGAFCELTPCVPGPVIRTTLAADQVIGTLTCKKGQEIGHDTRKRVVFCTTAKPAVVDGIPIAANAYTLFHPNGRIYQTHAGRTFERTLADGSKVTCGADLFALEPDGLLTYCRLGGPRSGTPPARIGAGIAFHRSGRIAGMTLDAPYTAAGLALGDGASVRWDDKGALIGGYSSTPIAAGALIIKYEFALHPSGTLKAVTLGKAAKVAGHEFPEFAKLSFRADGTLEAAEYVAKRGFMIHGEPWTDTRHMQFDRTGKITADRTEHYQAKEAPRKFRPKKP
jgi:hypothetical protein